MPFAIIGGMSLVALLYTSMNCAYFTLLTADEMKVSNAVAMVLINILTKLIFLIDVY